jgi:hypothetical protein
MIALLFRMCMTVALAFGALMLVSPTRYRAVLSIITRVDGKNSDSEPAAYNSGENWQIRLAGLLIVVGTSFILWRITTFHQMPGIPASQQGRETGPRTGSIWFNAAVGITLFAAGTYVLFRPASVAQWNARILSRGVVPDEKIREWRIGARVLGGAAVLTGVFILYYWAAAMRR